MKTGLTTLLVMISLHAGALAQLPARPSPDPGAEPNIFYGATPPDGEKSPVLVFIHGLRGMASDWWMNNNDMYDFAFRAGYRTAFISLSPDNTRNDAPIADNALVLLDALPKVAERFGVEKMYLICHSKGGLDAQAAMLDADILKLVKAIFLISTPNTGTELADWAFGPGRSIADGLGLLTPGVEALRTSAIAEFRAQADPVFENLDIPFYTIAGTTNSGNILLEVTGAVLEGLVPDMPNDGLVTVERTKLPISYGIDIGEVFAHHFQTDSGNVSFAKMNAQISGLEETSDEFRLVAKNGFGDPDNTWLWSMQWFKGKLYVGTGRAVHCGTFATAAVQQDIPLLYPPPGPDFGCPDDMRDLRLAAEIWQYTPELKTWRRVFKSPENLPVKFDESGEPTAFTGRDSAFRGMAVFREADGQEALYVAGVTSSSIFEKLPFYQENAFPPPRILRSADGETFEPIPQDPGTFLGDIVVNSPQDFKVRGFRSFAVYKGQLFVTASDFRGVGIILASSRPELGNDGWRQVSPSGEELPVWTLKVFNNRLYCVTGDRRSSVGYAVYRTDAEGPAPFTFTPVVTGGGEQSEAPLRSLNGLSLEVFQGKLYVGTDRQAEMIRIYPDDRWELVVGFPRETSQGFKVPISGIGQWFGNFFNGHFWRMADWDNHLYLGTWDWSIMLRPILVLDALFRHEFGTDLYRTGDGIHWTFLTKQGFGDPFTYGTRNFAKTPFGLFVATAKPVGGGNVFVNQSILDLDRDGDIDSSDVAALLLSLGQPAAGPEDPRDLDRDGTITVRDVRKLSQACTRPNCELITPENPLMPPPQRLEAASGFVVGQQVELAWEPVPGASSYRVFRSELRPIIDLFPPDTEVTIPGLGITVKLPDDFINGRFDEFCAMEENETNLICLINFVAQAVEDTSPFLGLPLFFVPVATTASTSFADPEVPATNLQWIYFVVALDEQGRQTGPSNIAGAPSYGIPATFPEAVKGLQRPGGKSPVELDFAESAQNAVFGAEQLALQGRLEKAMQMLDAASQEFGRGRQGRKADSVELACLLQALGRTLRLELSGVYPRGTSMKTFEALVREGRTGASWGDAAQQRHHP